ncbi:glutathione S-transferase family protein [Pikeienuella sp. HZG-20]|uniref:glutathione S-transferase family protein n=1 Tax=Paludibacillus litoralis TaxID=3133267 RepID=UPI0030ECF910
MYEVYGSPASRAARVIWMLEEIGAPYEIVPAKPHSAEALELNASGKIPVLVDDGRAIFDSTAILLHLADKHGKLTFPVGAPERDRMMSLICFAIDDVEQPLWTLTKHRAMLPEHLRAADAVQPACLYEFAKAMGTLEAYLGDGPFVMGDAFTVPDIILGHLGGWAKAMGFPAPEGEVGAYMARVRDRAGWRAVADARARAA